MYFALFNSSVQQNQQNNQKNTKLFPLHRRKSQTGKIKQLRPTRTWLSLFPSIFFPAWGRIFQTLLSWEFWSMEGGKRKNENELNKKEKEEGKTRCALERCYFRFFSILSQILAPSHPRDRIDKQPQFRLRGWGKPIPTSIFRFPPFPNVTQIGTLT